MSLEDRRTWVHKRSHEATTGSIDVDGSVQATLDEQIVDSLDVLVLACVSGPEDAADTDRILINKINSLFGINDVSLLSAVDESIQFFGLSASRV